MLVLRLARGRAGDLQDTGRPKGRTGLVGILLLDGDDDDGLVTLAVAVPVVAVVEQRRESVSDVICEVVPPPSGEGLVHRVLPLEGAGLDIALSRPRRDAVDRLALLAVADDRPRALPVLVVEVGQAVIDHRRVGDAGARTGQDDPRTCGRSHARVPLEGERSLVDAPAHVVVGVQRAAVLVRTRVIRQPLERRRDLAGVLHDERGGTGVRTRVVVDVEACDDHEQQRRDDCHTPGHGAGSADELGFVGGLTLRLIRSHIPAGTSTDSGSALRLRRSHERDDGRDDGQAEPEEPGEVERVDPSREEVPLEPDLEEPLVEPVVSVTPEGDEEPPQPPEARQPCQHAKDRTPAHIFVRTHTSQLLRVADNDVEIQ